MEAAGQRERLEPAVVAGEHAFAFGAFRLVREWADAERREREGPLEITEPRITRLVEEMGAGRPVGEPA